MLTDLTKQIDLKKPFQIIFNQTSKIIFNQLSTATTSSKIIFKQFSTITLLSKINFKQFSINSIIVTNNKSKKIYIKVKFEFDNKLIYNLINNYCRLCIFNTYKQTIFTIIYNKNQYIKRHRYYQRISNALYISQLFKKFRQYFEHCPSCQLNQTKKHRLYDKLMSIFNVFKPFHTLTMNFIIKLSNTYNAFLIVINKFFRHVMFIYNKTTYSIVE